jgi:hypothetical protein
MKLTVMASYDTKLLQRTLADIPGYMACKREDESCHWGQIHSSGGRLIVLS